jgi:hypothetical protein
VDHYQVLGVPRGADPVTIRRAYLRLARKHHPDLHAGEPAAVQAESRARMLEVNAAWAVLGDPERRAAYDRVARDGGPSQGAAPVGRDGRVQPAKPNRKGWTPRADDTGWMSDFDKWKEEADQLPPDLPGAGTRNPWRVLPIGVFVASVAIGCFALVSMIRALLALAYVGVAVSAVLFIAFPLLEMTRRRR